MGKSTSNIAKSAESTAKKGKINRNIVLTEFEQTIMCNTLSSFNEDGDLVREVNRSSFYGMTIYDKELEEEGKTQRIKFLSVLGRYKTSEDNFLSVSIAVVDDSRFYMILDNRDTEDQQLFVNDLGNMKMVLDNMSGSTMTEEDIAEELSAINAL